MRVALVTTVRNERRLLRENLRYHHWLGVERSFVFLDRSTDGSGETVRDLPGVTVVASSQPAAVPPRFAALPMVGNILAKLETHQTARQMVNTLVATDWARDAGCDWIVSLDPDELLCPSWTSLAAGDLVQQLQGVAEGIQAVQFLPLEVLPVRSSTGGTPFREASHFKNRFAQTGERYLHAHRFPKRVHDPYRGQDWMSTDYLGHVAGKAAGRTGRDLLPCSVHAFQAADGSRPATLKTGWLLHYCNASFDSFLTRFRHRRAMPARWVNGAAVDPAEQLWQAMVNDGAFTEAQLEDYFWQQIAPSDAEVSAWRAAAPDCLVEVPAVARAFAALG